MLAYVALRSEHVAPGHLRDPTKHLPTVFGRRSRATKEPDDTYSEFLQHRTQQRAERRGGLRTIVHNPAPNDQETRGATVTDHVHACISIASSQSSAQHGDDICVIGSRFEGR